MAITITLPNKIETLLQREAQEQQLSAEELALEILGEALKKEETFLSLEEVVAKIQATPPNPHSFRPAKGSLSEALREAPEDPHFNLAEWKKSWAAVAAEIKAVTRANTIAEGRG